MRGVWARAALGATGLWWLLLAEPLLDREIALGTPPGDAADVFVDRDDDGRMDDISGDGKVDLDDALLIYGMVEGLSNETWFQPFEGGLGIYPPNPRFGPMVHVDTRGSKTRWKG